MENIINVLKLEDKFQVVIFFPWEGNSLLLRTELKDTFKYLPDGDGDLRQWFARIIKEYPNASLEDMRTIQKRRVRITLSFSSKEEFDRFCTNEASNIKVIMAQVSVPWDGGYVSMSKNFGDSEGYLNLLGGSDTWRAHRLIGHLVKNYEDNLSSVESNGEKLFATVEFSQKEEFDVFYQEHRA